VPGNAVAWQSPGCNPATSEDREAVPKIVAAGGGDGFVSAAGFRQDNRLVPISLDKC
jgi:hypothetical protein